MKLYQVDLRYLPIRISIFYFNYWVNLHNIYHESYMTVDKGCICKYTIF